MLSLPSCARFASNRRGLNEMSGSMGASLPGLSRNGNDQADVLLPLVRSTLLPPVSHRARSQKWLHYLSSCVIGPVDSCSCDEVRVGVRRCPFCQPARKPWLNEPDTGVKDRLEKIAWNNRKPSPHIIQLVLTSDPNPSRTINWFPLSYSRGTCPKYMSSHKASSRCISTSASA
jgi:hypothetical protein